MAFLRACCPIRILILLCCCQAGFAFKASAETAPEYRVKAAYLFNFVQFVEWPAETFPEPKSPFVIGILGDDPFGKFLDETVQGEVVQGRRIEVKRFDSISESEKCHILFVSESESARIDKIIKHFTGKPVLTVGDSHQFANRGGMVRFVTESNKVRLRINIETVRASRLTVSSKLLRVAEIVGKEKE